MRPLFIYDACTPARGREHLPPPIVSRSLSIPTSLRLCGLGFVLCFCCCYSSDHSHSFKDGADDDVLPIKNGKGTEGYHELAVVAVRATRDHRDVSVLYELHAVILVTKPEERKQ